MRDAEVADVVAEVHAALRDVGEGAVASYIPELARADPAGFGLAVVTVDGRTATAGDAGRPFMLQSCSKPMTYGLALEERGPEVVHARIGAEPTGDRFNSIIKLDGRDRPHNPMINAGAIAVTSLVGGEGRAARSGRILDLLGRYTGRPAVVDARTYESERATGHRNRAIAHLMLNYGAIEGPLDEHHDLYFEQCSVLVTARDLAAAAATLANGGVNPLTGARALAAQLVPDVLSVMFTCGLYDGAGQWARDVGLPAKSGVGGGILAVAPGRLGIGVYSPLLDARGNSVRGVLACRELSRRLGLHVFTSSRGGPPP
jgi:glutaminase